MKRLITLSVALLHFSILLAQTDITLGVRYNVKDNKIEKDSSFSDNLYYLFEYDFLKMFDSYIHDHYKDDYNIQYQKIKQGSKLDYLSSNHKNNVDGIIYSVSITEERSKNYLFSLPYFSNKSIVLASINPELGTVDFNKNITVGYIKKTTSGKELRKIQKKHPKTLTLRDYDNFEEQLAALKNGTVGAITGDRSLLSSYFLNRELYFNGNLPTSNSQIADFYGVISNKDNTQTIELFNKFIRKNEGQIKELSDKYFSIIDNKLLNHNNENAFSYQTVFIGFGVILLLFGLLVWYFLKRLKKMELEKEAIRKKHLIDDTKEQLTNILDSAFSKFRDKLDAQQIAKIGIEFFDTANEKITYIGSGGFLSDKTYGKKWKKSIHGALKRGIVLDRIIDLPKIDFNKLQFENMDYFHPESYDRVYVQKYLKWLLLQYIDFSNYGENFNIHNSRGASLWGYGLVIMIKDTSEVLLFTTNKDKKIGSVIVNQELATHFSDLMEIIKNVGKEIDAQDLEREFFSTENNLKKLVADFKNEIQQNSCIKITDELNARIDSLTNTINKRFNEHNNTK